MKTQFIFSKKENSTISFDNSNQLFQNMFKSIFNSVTFDTFQVIVGTSPETITYKSSASDNDIIYLTLSYDGSPLFSAKVLSEAKHLLVSGSHRKDFHIINSYDEPSLYYCEKLAPRFGKFERLMRSFIYISLTKSLGIDWFEKTFTKEIKAVIKDKGKISDTDLIEHGLYEMTFQQLYDFLFTDFSYCTTDFIIYNHLLNKDLSNMDKSDIIATLNLCEKKDLWSRFFSSTTFDLKEPLHNMRDYRNKVAHNKFINPAEYNDCKRNLIKINSTLETAIDKLNTEIYTERHLLDTIVSFGALFAGFFENSHSTISTAQRNLTTLGRILINAFEPYSSISKAKKMYGLGSMIAEFQKVSSFLQDITMIQQTEEDK